MDPAVILNNLATFLSSLFLPTAMVAAITAALLYGVGKWAGSGQWVAWGRNSGIGAIVLFAGSTAVSLLQFVAQRLTGG